MSYLSFFGLMNNYDWQDLDNAYQSKLNSLDGMNLSRVDREIYGKQVYRLYREAKRDLLQRERADGEYGFMRNYLWNGIDYFDRLERRMNQRFNQLYERLGARPVADANNLSSFSSSSYREVLQPDGSAVVVEETSNGNGEGNLNSTRNSYRRYSDGRQEPVDYNEALRLVGNSVQSPNRHIE